MLRNGLNVALPLLRLRLLTCHTTHFRRSSIRFKAGVLLCLARVHQRHLVVQDTLLECLAGPVSFRIACLADLDKLLLPGMVLLELQCLGLSHLYQCLFFLQLKLFHAEAILVKLDRLLPTLRKQPRLFGLVFFHITQHLLGLQLRLRLVLMIHLCVLLNLRLEEVRNGHVAITPTYEICLLLQELVLRQCINLRALFQGATLLSLCTQTLLFELCISLRQHLAQHKTRMELPHAIDLAVLEAFGTLNGILALLRLKPRLLNIKLHALSLLSCMAFLACMQLLQALPFNCVLPVLRPLLRHVTQSLALRFVGEHLLCLGAIVIQLILNSTNVVFVEDSNLCGIRMQHICRNVLNFRRHFVAIRLSKCLLSPLGHNARPPTMLNKRHFPPCHATRGSPQRLGLRSWAINHATATIESGGLNTFGCPRFPATDKIGK
eukprot:Opistho-2@34117